MGQVSTVQFDQELIERYGGRGPRYTSYPTAVQFNARFGEVEYRAQAQPGNGPGRADPLSIYIHIPFCHSLCFYCGCSKIVTRDKHRAEAYLRLLLREISLQAALFDRGRPVQQLHLGGGTPTYLSPEQLDRLMDQLHRDFTLPMNGSQEFSLEIDPRTVSPKEIGALAGCGFNRISMGVQDFDADVQRAVNRMQSADETGDLVTAARASGFRSVSLDLIYGLPLQTVASFDRTLETVLAMRPDRLANYSYAHLPQMFRAQKLIHEQQLPAPAVKLEILRHTIERLTDAGYVYIGMDHFALADDELVRAQARGELQRNFQGYSTHARCDLIGLGVSAIGRIGDCYSQNVKDIGAYAASLRQGKLPIERGLVMTADDRIRGAIIQEIMCNGRLEFGRVSHAFEINFRDYFAAELDQLAQLESDGLVALDEIELRVSDRGRLMLRAIAMVFDRYLVADRATTNFSKII